MEGNSMNCIKHGPNIKGAEVETMGDRARVGVYVTTEKDKGSQERVAKRSEAVSRRSKEESEWYPVKVSILTGSSLVGGGGWGLAEFRVDKGDVRVGDVKDEKKETDRVRMKHGGSEVTVTMSEEECDRC
jgi:hypothetical protein